MGEDQDNGFVERPKARRAAAVESLIPRLVETARNGKAIEVESPRRVSGSIALGLERRGFRVRTAKRDGKTFAWCEPRENGAPASPPEAARP